MDQVVGSRFKTCKRAGFILTVDQVSLWTFTTGPNVLQVFQPMPGLVFWCQCWPVPIVYQIVLTGDLGCERLPVVKENFVITALRPYNCTVLSPCPVLAQARPVLQSANSTNSGFLPSLLQSHSADNLFAFLNLHLIKNIVFVSLCSASVFLKHVCQ